MSSNQLFWMPMEHIEKRWDLQNFVYLVDGSVRNLTTWRTRSFDCAGSPQDESEVSVSFVQSFRFVICLHLLCLSYSIFSPAVSISSTLLRIDFYRGISNHSDAQCLPSGFICPEFVCCMARSMNWFDPEKIILKDYQFPPAFMV